MVVAGSIFVSLPSVILGCGRPEGETRLKRCVNESSGGPSERQ